MFSKYKFIQSNPTATIQITRLNAHFCHAVTVLFNHVHSFTCGFHFLYLRSMHSSCSVCFCTCSELHGFLDRRVLLCGFVFCIPMQFLHLSAQIFFAVHSARAKKKKKITYTCTSCQNNINCSFWIIIIRPKASILACRLRIKNIRLFLWFLSELSITQQ